MTIAIVGAGLAGLLAGNMLRHRNPVIYELQSELPNNHSAVLRFRTSAVGDVLNIPFRKVRMIKAHAPWKNEVADALAYSFKNSGNYRSDRSITAGFTIADRWIAPPDLIPRMAERLDIRYGKPFDFRPELKGNFDARSGPIISTLPMPVLSLALGYSFNTTEVLFNSTPGLNIKATISNCDAYVSLLVPDPAIPFSRISITGDEIIIEMANLPNKMNADMVVSNAAMMLGLDGARITDICSYPQRYSKITPIDDEVRKAFQHWATINHNVYSLGRFATWRPELLLDDLIKDIRKIDGWIGHTSKYDVVRDR